MAISADAAVVELLDSSNYVDWSVLVKNYLLAQDLWDAVEEEYEDDEEEEEKGISKRRKEEGGGKIKKRIEKKNVLRASIMGSLNHVLKQILGRNCKSTTPTILSIHFLK
ncbi:unnamed protein product [Prunus armeniaca]